MSGMPELDLDLQLAIENDTLPPAAAFRIWATTALQATEADGVCSLSIRVVDEAESQQLNNEYRGKDKPTNVLSFPFEMPPEIGDEEPPHLGDLVICAPVVDQEAEQQNKTLASHWAHMVVHGVLHLRGFDHEANAEAEQMEDLERQILAALGFDDPYKG